MKCPLLMYNYLPEENPTRGKRTDCIKEECAWWYEGDQCCAITNIARDSTLFLLALESLAYKLPQARQTY